MSRSLTLIITIDEDSVEEDGFNTDGIVSSMESQGIPPEVATTLLLISVYGRVSMEMRREIEQAVPLQSEEVTGAVAALNARLRMIDEIMHLPEIGPTAGFHITL